MIKKIVLGLVGLIVVIALIGMLLPRRVHVQRSTDIARPAGEIYAIVDSFQQFDRWSPWADLDPHMTQTLEGPREGVGATLHWSGNDKVGSGSQVIVAATPDRAVDTTLDFGKMGVSKAALLLAPQPGGTRVTWTLDVDMGAGPIGRYFGLMMNKMIGKDYDNGLRKLKALAESMPDADIAGLDVQAVDMRAVPVLLVDEASPPDAADIAKAYSEAYARIGQFMAKNQLHQAGAPLGIGGTTQAGWYSFQAGIPVDSAGAGNADGVRASQTYAGKALKTTHVGAYDCLQRTLDRLHAYAAAHAYTTAGAPISWYVDDPGKTPADHLRTEVYWPIR